MSTERDELAVEMSRHQMSIEEMVGDETVDVLCSCGMNGPTTGWFVRHQAARIMAAGYRKPRTVTTADELDALPVGSVVLDGDGDPWKRRADGLWLSGRMVEESETVFWCGPDPDDHPTVLHEGGAS